MSDKQEQVPKKDMAEVKTFKRESLKKTKTEEKYLLPSQDIIDQEKKNAAEPAS